MDQDTARHIEHLTQRLTAAELRAANLEFTLGRLIKQVMVHQPKDVLAKFMDDTATIAHKSYTTQDGDPTMKEVVENYLEILANGIEFS